jgi:DNA-directed RNA polymerase specialized sigma24 family protein
VIEDTEIRAFLQAEYPRLVNPVAFVTGDLGAAEDAVQEALVRAWIRSERVRRSTPSPLGSQP